MTSLRTHILNCCTVHNAFCSHYFGKYVLYRLPLCPRAAGSTAIVSVKIAARLILFCKWTTLSGGLERDVVYLGWPIALSYMSPNAGEWREEGCGVSANEYSCAHGAQRELWRSNNSLYEPNLSQLNPLIGVSRLKSLIVKDHFQLFISIVVYVQYINSHWAILL